MTIKSDTVSFTEEKKDQTVFLLSDMMADLYAESACSLYHMPVSIQGNLFLSAVSLMRIWPRKSIKTSPFALLGADHFPR